MPKKPSIADVVRLSGVSRATVDRVLSGRTTVKAETARKVRAAIQQLQYSASALERNIPDRDLRIDVFLSVGKNPFFAEIWKDFKAALAELGLSEDYVHLIGFDPYNDSEIWEALDGRREDLDALILVGADTPKIRHKIDDITSDGTKVITVISDILGTQRAAYFGQDNFAAGRVAGRVMTDIVPVQSGTIAVLIGHLQFRHLMDRYSGFRQMVKQRMPGFDVALSEPYGTEVRRAFEMVRSLQQRHKDLAGIYLLGGGNPGIYQALQQMQAPEIKVIAHELTAESRLAMERGHIDYVLAQDTRDIARRAFSCAIGLKTPGSFCPVMVYMLENLPSES